MHSIIRVYSHDSRYATTFKVKGPKVKVKTYDITYQQ